MQNLYDFAETLLTKIGVEEMIATICNLSDEKITQIMEG